MARRKKKADVCLLLEGTYPYVSGGVSNWTHDLIQQNAHLSFYLMTLVAPKANTKVRYTLPSNVVGKSVVTLQTLSPGAASLPKREQERLFSNLELPLLKLQTHPTPEVLSELIEILSNVSRPLGSRILLDSEDAWRMLVRMYNASMGDTSFLDYFWSWRALVGGLFSVLLSELPEAEVYHALCTGYAGLFLSRARLQTQKPCFVTEHGIYTNERRIEIASADWILDQKSFDLSLKKDPYDREVRDFWVDSFTGYSTLCYELSDTIVTLYEGNQEFQKMDGADPKKLRIIPNGINCEHYSSIKREKKHPPTIVLIGRVVPIKDVKTFIRAAGFLQKDIPNLKAYVLGPTDEDKLYYEECVDVVKHLGLTKTVTFTGKVSIDSYLAKADVAVLSSISEAQPLVLLEAGAAGIPFVATDVGSCRDIILGRQDEVPYLGAGGGVVPLSNPRAMADELYTLLTNKEYHKRCSKALSKRVHKYYTEEGQKKAYNSLYDELFKLGKKREKEAK